MEATRPESARLEVQLASEEDTDRLGRAIAQIVGPGTVIGLAGPLGAGKTRLARAIAEALGVDPSAISSPTFVLIQEYEGRLPVYHFDTYRLPTPEAFEELGSAEYWRDGVSLVEWADRVESLLPDDRWWIAIDPSGAGPSARRARIAAPPTQPKLADVLFARLAAPATEPDSSPASVDLTT